MPQEDIVIRSDKGPIQIWPTLINGAFVTAVWSVGSGLLGTILGMLVTLRGFSGMEGFFHVVFTVPLSSAVLGGLLWLLAWLSVLALSRTALQPEAVLWARWIACCLVFLFQAAVWVMLTKLGAQ